MDSKKSGIVTKYTFDWSLQKSSMYGTGPPNRKMINYTSSTQDTKNYSVFPVVKNSVAFCVLGGTRKKHPVS